MKNIIRTLSEQTINQIAAGEVVENPASVVKEIVENAIDARARKITIEILSGGFQSIKISDDGQGMSPEDALLSLQRHATSKIQEVGDLFHLHTMGFRGEALASIAAISKLTLTTALQGEVGSHLVIEGGKLLFVEPSSRPRGTTIEINSLFFNVPARKKFQKSTSASSAEITRMVTVLALAHPHVGFKLLQQGRSVFSAEGSQAEAHLLTQLRKRSEDLLGQTVYSVHVQEGEYAITGWLADPQLSRYNRSGQYLFVNHRPVSCMPLSFAVRDGYGTRIAVDRHPAYVMHLQLPPSVIDVNVHPQKKEIRLREEAYIKDILRKAVHQAFQQSEVFSIPEVEVPQNLVLDNFSNFWAAEPAHTTKQTQETIPFPEEEHIYVGLFEQYLIVEAKSLMKVQEGVVWIDLLAAEARILYERLLKREKEEISQRLLIPLTVSFSKAESALILSAMEDLKSLSIELRPIGETAFLVEAIPLRVEKEEIPELLQELIQDRNLSRSAEKICRRSRKRKFSMYEAKEILRQLLKTADPHHCPQGKATFYHVKKDDIENYFTHK